MVRVADGVIGYRPADPPMVPFPNRGTAPALHFRVTAPRQYLPGTTYLVTRRCFQRHFFLRPCRQTNDTFRFVLAVAAERYAIHLHAVCVLSNHYHLVVTDPFARLPAFLRDLNSLVARALNASIPRWEDFWSASGHSAVTLGSSADILDKAAYVLANPVAARLVRRAHQWPGVWSPPAMIGATALVVKRPSQFFDPEGPLPDSATLSLTAPPGFHSAETFREQLEAALAAREAEAARSSTRFLGLLKVLAQRPSDRPRDREARRGLSPRVASRDKWRRMEMLGRLQKFAQDYRRALEAWRAGYEPVFPAGTYLMRVVHGATCEGAG